jgi:membrane protease YdiL (CAAX protease family)
MDGSPVAWLLRTPDGRRLRAPWRLGLHLLLLVTAGVAALVPVRAIAGLLGVTPGSGTGPSLLVSTVPLGAGVVASVVVAARWLDRRPLSDLGVRGPASDLAAGLALGGGAMAGVFGTELAAGWLVVEGVGEPGRLAATLAAGLVLMVAVAVYEELLVRGYWLTNLAEGLRWLPGVGARRAVAGAVALTGLAFGALHAANPNATPASALTISVAGVVLGLGYALTGSLALPTGFHFAWNFAQAFVFGFPTSGVGFGASVLAVEQTGPTIATGGPFGPEAGAVGLAWLLVAAAGLLWWVRRTRDGVELRADVAEPARPPGAE